MAKLHPLSKASENFAAKLAPKYDGIFRINEFMSPVIAKLIILGSSVHQGRPYANNKC